MQNIGNFGGPLWEVVKYAFLILLLIYLGFSLVVLRQAQMMIKTLAVGFDKPILVVAYLHLIFSIGIFLVALVVL